MPPHPLGILPEGHILMDGGDMTMRNAGINGDLLMLLNQAREILSAA